jgi:DNA-binding HxlR family transcriptional regulator
MIIKRFTWPAELTLTLIGGKWKALILHHLMEGESRRFGELKRLLTGISSKMLAKHLREMEYDGLITKMEVSSSRETGLGKPRIVYTSTTRSRTLAPILEAMRLWGSDHMGLYGPGENGTGANVPEPSRAPD